MSSNLRHWDCEHTDLLASAVPGTHAQVCMQTRKQYRHYGSLISVGNPKLWERIMGLVSLEIVATGARLPLRV